MTLTTKLTLAPLLGLSLVFASTPLDAQSRDSVTASTARMASRAELTSAADEYDRLAASTAYSETARQRARSNATEVRRRLTEGDFKVGDRLLIRVEGQVALSDTVTVNDGQRITIGNIRQVVLAGVLRSELESMLRAELSEVVRNTTVSATPLMRVAVLGAVTRPGFLNVPAATTLDRLITLAGGPVANAGIDRITVRRGEEVVINAPRVRSAMAVGTTIEAMGLIDGDALSVPLIEPAWTRAQTIQLITTLGIPMVTLFLVRRN